MPPVAILPSDLVNQIAAGEVVERPASVVKELVENAIDAGATTIDVILENGGRKLIEIRDDGSGMPEADALLAIQRHATSKLRSFDDLARVRTLGFRGEALPSIASVSRFTLLTSDGKGEHATALDVDPFTGRSTTRPAARDRGTTVTVRELFENVPARRKFLKSSDAEFRSIVTVLTSYALPNPARAFRLEHNGRVVLDLPPAASTRDRVIQILGGDSAEYLVEVDATIGGTRAGGFVTRGLRFGSRRNQYFFVNGRLVKDRVLTHAANRAAEQFDFDGHPAIVLFVDIDPELVDVNVHPAKTEVRFRDSKPVHVAVEQGIKRALGGAEEGSGLLSPGGALPMGNAGDALDRDAAFAMPPSFQRPLLAPGTFARGAAPGVQFTPLYRDRALFSDGAMVQPPLPSRGEDEPIAQLGDLQGRVIGQYRMSYVLLDTPGGLRLVDQHVAHERVLYDRYRAMVEDGRPVSQQLLTPMLYETGAAESAALESHLAELQAVGFDLERFSGNTFAISAIPSELLRHDLHAFFRKLLDASLEEKGSHLTHLREKVCASLACQAAIKVHRPLTGDEMATLVANVLRSSNPFACPHGRPIVVDIRHVDIEKHFHRR
jgi:DNA mismatch repair protein MutL